jgi:hypothetical protein
MVKGPGPSPFPRAMCQGGCVKVSRLIDQACLWRPLARLRRFLCQARIREFNSDAQQLPLVQRVLRGACADCTGNNDSFL